MVYGMLILHVVLVILITKLQDFADSLIHLVEDFFSFNIIKQFEPFIVSFSKRIEGFHTLYFLSLDASEQCR